MKVVPFYPNNADNLHCLQACVESALNFFNIKYLKKEIDKNTGFFGQMSWTPHSVNWLSKKGLKVKLISPFRYDLLVSDGENYLRSFKGNAIFQKEKAEGQYDFLDEVRKATHEMISEGLWENRQMTIPELSSFLSEEDNLAIAKTVHEFLSNKAIAGTSHFVTVIKQYKPGQWLINDPGLPPIERRKVDQVISGNIEILGDVISIKK